MAQAQRGNTVKVHYTGTLADGTVFDSSEEREPLEFVLGAGEVIPGFDAAVDGMSPGDAKTVTIPAAQAYGPVHAELTAQVSRDQFPADIDPQVGQQLQMQLANGQQIPVQIIDVTDDDVTLDANHPLAGQDLTFALELVEIE